MGIRVLKLHTYSQLIARQVNGEYLAKDLSLQAYMNASREARRYFDEVTVTQVPRLTYSAADALTRLASLEESTRILVSAEVLDRSSVGSAMILLDDGGGPSNWMDPFHPTGWTHSWLS